MARSRTQLGGYTPRCGEKSAEVIDKSRVARWPLRKRVRNPLKRKDLNVKKAEMHEAQEENAGIGEWHFPTRSGSGVEAQCEQTRERIAHKYTECQFIFWVSFEWSRKALKCLQVTCLNVEVQEWGRGCESGESWEDQDAERRGRQIQRPQVQNRHPGHPQTTEVAPRV